MQKWQCRVAPSLGEGFAGTAHEAWGTIPYTDPNEPCVFFGMYGMKDVQSLMSHTGTRAILWAGSDIRNLIRGYWLDKTGAERIDVKVIAEWMNDCCINYCENLIEYITLRSVGISSKIVPSFLGNVDDYQPQEIDPKPRYYTSVSGDDFELYGWDEIHELAHKNPHTEYHLYGNTGLWLISSPNVFVHGRVSQSEMDNQTKSMTGALRLTRFDGASEILVKSTLWGQKPISPYIHYDWLGDCDKLISILNKYPWVSNT